MKLDKRLRTLVDKMAKNSFENSGLLSEDKVVRFVKILKQLPRPLAITSLSLYQKRLKVGVEKSVLRVQTAVPLSKTELEKIVKAIKGKFLINNVENIVDDKLLGGIKVRIGDIIFDDSVLNRLSQLKGAING